MFDRETAIAAWRQRLVRTGNFFESDLDELEEHVRDHLDALEEVGLAGEAAFRIALESLGEAAALGDEFAKVNRLAWRARHSSGSPWGASQSSSARHAFGLGRPRSLTRVSRSTCRPPRCARSCGEPRSACRSRSSQRCFGGWGDRGSRRSPGQSRRRVASGCSPPARSSSSSRWSGPMSSACPVLLQAILPWRPQTARDGPRTA